ncbi:MAG: ABC transporter permease [Lachnospiraceae bacterium]|nr:ABC transporter permease [Lachnospiraceae bacterium]
MKKIKNILETNVLYTLIAIVIGFVIGALFLAVAGISPGAAYAKLIDGVFGRPKYLVWTMVYGSPLIFTGLSVAFSLRTGVFNIGAEGQFVVGSLAACAVGILVQAPPVIHALLCILAAALAGFLWSYLVGLMKVKRGIHEVLSYIMFNWIAFYLSNYMVNTELLHKEGDGEATKNVLDSARILFPEGILKVLDCSGANWGFLLAIITAVAMWIIIEKTTLGYRLKAVGFNKEAAKFGGINADKSILTALGISGALAGVGGAVQLLGMGARISQFAGQEGYGFQGITVALIAGSNPIGCIFSGIFYGAMKYGGSKLTMVGAPEEVIDIIMGCVIIFIAISQVFKALFKKTVKGKESK